MEGSDTAPVGTTTTTTTAAKTCTCYCWLSWGAALAAPDVEDPGSPTTSTGLLTETETETGVEYWTANVNEKTYVCGTTTVTLVTPTTLNCAHNTYSSTKSRSRTIVWTKVTIGPYTIGPWTIGPITIGPVTLGPWTIGPFTTPAVTFNVPTPGWTAWSAPVRTNGPVSSPAQALASTSPPSIDCATVGIACP